MFHQASHTFSRTNFWGGSEYSFHFNGMEKVDEINGSGNALDFGARIYDSRLGRMFSIDQFFKKFSYESNYIISGNSPICLVDENGNKKVYYITIINDDGSTQSFKIVDSKYIIRKPVTITRKICGPGDCEPRIIKETETEYFDAFQHIIINKQTGKTTFGKEQTGAKRSSNEYTRWIEDNITDTEVKGSYGGIGWYSSSGNTQETRGGDGKNQMDNIDALISLLSLSKSTAAGDGKNLSKMIKSIKDYAEKQAASQTGLEAISATKESIKSQQEPAEPKRKPIGITCDNRGCKGDTFPLNENFHTGKIDTVYDKKK